MLPENLRSPSVFGGVRVAQSLVFYVVSCVPFFFLFFFILFLAMAVSVYFRCIIWLFHWYLSPVFIIVSWNIFYEQLTSTNFLGTANPCTINNGGCDHICNENGESKDLCSCRNGYKLEEKTRCVSKYISFIANSGYIV